MSNNHWFYWLLLWNKSIEQLYSSQQHWVISLVHYCFWYYHCCCFCCFLIKASFVSFIVWYLHLFMHLYYILYTRGSFTKIDLSIILAWSVFILTLCLILCWSGHHTSSINNSIIISTNLTRSLIIIISRIYRFWSIYLIIWIFTNLTLVI